MRIGEPLIYGTFIRRDNRFAATVEVAGAAALAHVASSGRMAELLVPGAVVALLPRDQPGRRTRYRLLLVRHRGRWVSVDAQMPNRLVAEALAARALPPFAGYDRIMPEARRGPRRVDFYLQGVECPCWLEVKSVTLVTADGHALFPDAPTLRGREHLASLQEAVQEAARAAALFVIQRDDARDFRPHDAHDPAFGAAMRRAVAAGVEVYAYCCAVSPAAITLAAAVPVIL